VADVFTAEKRSKVMALIRAKDTKPELAFGARFTASAIASGYMIRDCRGVRILCFGDTGSSSK
jgi:G:T-mismatch repair DNA endonuclease (very short patch repair protein)